MKIDRSSKNINRLIDYKFRIINYLSTGTMIPSNAPRGVEQLDYDTIGARSSGLVWLR